ncbi:MAG: Esterase [Verrucomicrobiales bacterium]|nr:Esterase [Verrucomicrobiales bacterium]
MKTNLFKKSCLLTLGAVAATTALQASTDYAPAVWRQAYSGHWYTSGNGHKFAVIHDMEGYYASTISYFQRSTTQASVHYCVNGVKDATSDYPAGELTQMVLESNYAWHVNCWNTHSLGTEHEGFASNPAWYTDAMYNTSGALQKHFCEKFGFAKDRNHVIGHDQKRISGWPAYASANLGIDPYCNTHTDPGSFWNWTKLMGIIGGSSGSPANNRVGIARTPSGQGYWIVGSDGGVFSFGDAGFYGSMGGQALNSPVVAICARPQGDGYWLVAADGGIFTFGGAPFQGSMGGQPLNQPIVGMACTANGTGYWLVAKDGGIFSFNAPFNGSAGGGGLTDFVGMTATPANGYWLVRGTGSIYSYGPGYYGGGEAGSGVKAVCSTSDGGGYWQVRDNGSIYTYGNGTYQGGANEPGLFVAMARGPSNNGYFLLKKDGSVYTYGDAPYKGGANF